MERPMSQERPGAPWGSGAKVCVGVDRRLAMERVEGPGRRRSLCCLLSALIDPRLLLVEDGSRPWWGACVLQRQ